MKFKFLFLLFSITLILFFVIIIAFPSLMLSGSGADSFADSSFGIWRMNWPFIILWIFLFSVMCVFYFSNRRLFELLEKEDWPALVRYLEDRVIQKGKYSARLVRLLANSYLVLSDSAAVMSLENKLAIAKPSLIDKNVLLFGTARILSKDISGAVRFFDTRKDKVKPIVLEWTRWYLGFALLLDRQYERSGEEFSILASVSKDGIITALSSYFLCETLAKLLPLKQEKFQEIALSGRLRVLEEYPQQSVWIKEVSRLSSEIHAAAISKYMEETRLWLYSNG